MPVEKEIIDKIPTAGAEEIGAPLSGNIWKVMVLPHQKINEGLLEQIQKNRHYCDFL
jgi:oxaloacetate decarboxylase alpha subunit